MEIIVKRNEMDCFHQNLLHKVTVSRAISHHFSHKSKPIRNTSTITQNTCILIPMYVGTQKLQPLQRTWALQRIGRMGRTVGR